MGGKREGGEGQIGCFVGSAKVANVICFVVKFEL